jgi:hypothetical protein
MLHVLAPMHPLWLSYPFLKLVEFLKIPWTLGVAGFELLLRQKVTGFEPYLHPHLPQFAGIV